MNEHQRNTASAIGGDAAALGGRQSPLKVQFVITSLPVGGAETLLLNLIRKMDKTAFDPQVVCLKEPGALGDQIADEVNLHSGLLEGKWDVGVLPRLANLFRSNRTDAVVTVGAGDKMFWGRLAAKLAAVPVVCSALHSTGWPDGVGRLNRMLTGITDGFIACANGHAEHLVRYERFPANRVFMIPNGVDTDRFRPNHSQRTWLREELGVPQDVPVVGIVAALREEKNHLQFVAAAKETLREHPTTHFVIVGDGPEHASIEAQIQRDELDSQIHLLGNRSDTERILAGLDVFCLTSRNEANPVSILEALSCGTPVVSPDVGSISETVLHEQTGLLTEPLSVESTAGAITQLLGDPSWSKKLGLSGRQLVRRAWSLEAMVDGYEGMIAHLYNTKAALGGRFLWQRPHSEAALRVPAGGSESENDAHDPMQTLPLVGDTASVPWSSAPVTPGG